jgi:pimeloyl-ACP methyl ester carboxylesterase
VRRQASIAVRDLPQPALNLKYVPIKRAGHFAMREAPDVFNKEVIAFLTQT